MNGRQKRRYAKMIALEYLENHASWYVSNADAIEGQPEEMQDLVSEEFQRLARQLYNRRKKLSQ